MFGYPDSSSLAFNAMKYFGITRIDKVKKKSQL